MKVKLSSTDGSCLVELFLVLLILSLFAFVAIPVFSGLKGRAEEAVCTANSKQLARQYNTFLAMYARDHEDGIFRDYLETEEVKSLCPKHGEFTYAAGQVWCFLHADAEKLCAVKRKDLQDAYNAHIATQPSHLIIQFAVFRDRRQPICPSDGAVSWSSGKVLCGVHSTEGDTGGGGTPFL